MSIAEPPANWPEEPLSRADAANVQLDRDDQVNVVMIAAELGPGGFVAGDGRVDLAPLRSLIAARLAVPDRELRRFSQRLGGDPRAPHWRTCVPDLNWHIRPVDDRHGRAGLTAVCAELMTTALPRDRPLWELLVLPGTPQDAARVVLRLHHCVADGIGGVRLVQRLLTGSLADQPQPAPPRPRSKPKAGWSIRGLWRVAAMLLPRIGPTVMLGRIGPERQISFAEVNLDAFAAGARQAGGTLNDGLLAAVAIAVSSALRERGAPVPSSIRASVPVALADRGESGNATGVMVVKLPARLSDPAAVVARIAGQTHQAKAAARRHGTYELTRSRLGTWLFAQLARRQRFIALFVTNVRGPTQPLTIGGAELVRLWPVTPIQGNVRVAVAAISYAGRLGCAVHTDAGALTATVAGDALQRALTDIAGGVLTTAAQPSIPAQNR